MRTSWWCFGVLSIFGCLVSPALAQQTAPLKGMVWRVPGSLSEAEADLLQMHRMGVQAVRSSLIRREGLLLMADTLGLRIFQELPVDDVPASRLPDMLDNAQRQLVAALQRARQHPSVRDFGLAVGCDMSEPEAKNYLSTLIQIIQRLGPPGSRAYYVTPFIESDCCSSQVDFVLLDARDVPDPMVLLTRWKAAHTTPVGLANLGTWVDPTALIGYRVPNSPEYQARYLETHLQQLLTARPGPMAFFVERWRDDQADEPSIRHNLRDPYARRYGLLGTMGVRPAFDVVGGLYSGQQTVFAFGAPGATERQTVYWLILFGWSVIILLASVTLLLGRFQLFTRRYFFNHGNYIDLLRRGRELEQSLNTAMLLILALCAGVTGTAALQVLYRTRYFATLFDVLPETVQLFVLTIILNPWMMFVLCASVYVVILIFWAVLLTSLAPRQGKLKTTQMLVLWPRWPLLFIMILVLVTYTLPHHRAVYVMAILMGFWLLTSWTGITRTCLDFARVTHSTPLRVVLVGWCVPLILLGLFVGFVLSQGALPDLTFAWHRVMRP